jgi:glycosyltransferase involved in cell wall biosynthesis
MTRDVSKNKDFLFVLPSFSFSPPGGYLVVFELATFLKDNDYNVSIVFIRNILENLDQYLHDSSLVSRKRDMGLRNVLFNKYFQRKSILNLILKFSLILKPIFSLVGLHVNYEALLYLENIDWEVHDCIPKSISVTRVIATAWETAYFVKFFEKAAFRYYLVQHSEDDPSFSGSLSKLAADTYNYNFKLKKIVINRATLQRFKSENPIKISVAAHVSGQLQIAPSLRNSEICIQLRSGEDKGAVFGVQAAEIIHEKEPNTIIRSFGNYHGRIPPFIHHFNFLSQDDYVKQFNECSIFILPSLVEGFSTPVLEAMSCGCVPVATACGGPEEIIFPEENGILVPIKSSQAIADAVLNLLKDNDKRIEMAYRAADRSKDFSYERMGKSFLEGINANEGSIDL